MVYGCLFLGGLCIGFVLAFAAIKFADWQYDRLKLKARP